MRVRLGGALLAAGIIVGSASGAPAPSPITVYAAPSGSSPWGIAKGPDGALLFTENGRNAVGRVTVKGAFTQFKLPANASDPLGIASGPGGLWVASHNGVIVSVTTGGKTKAYTIPSDHFLYDITAGPDGNMWFTEQPPTAGGGDTSSSIGKITPGGTITEYPVLPSQSNPEYITAAGGDLWFTDGDSDAIGRVTPAGAVKEFKIPGGHAIPQGITKGRDGAL